MKAFEKRERDGKRRSSIVIDRGGGGGKEGEREREGDTVRETGSIKNITTIGCCRDNQNMTIFRNKKMKMAVILTFIIRFFAML